MHVNSPLVACTGDHQATDLTEVNRKLNDRVILITDQMRPSKAFIDRLVEAASLQEQLIKTSVFIRANMPSSLYPDEYDFTIDECDDFDNRDCKNDHGERTNYKLKDQPFYVRGRNGKMRKY